MQVAANYAKKRFLGPVTDKIHKNQVSFETDPQVLAVSQQIADQQQRHWYNKKVKATPDLILSKEERKILNKVKKRAWYLDKGFHCCCFNIGLDGIVGLIPGIGDALTAAIAMQLIKTASNANLPKWLIAKMMGNVMLDFLVGLTPVAGDLLDILFKCNWRNALLLEEYLIQRRMEEIRSEKGNNDVVLNDDHTVTITTTEPSSSAQQQQQSITSPKPAAIVSHHHSNNGNKPPTLDDETTTKDKHKYGTFF
ncbi:uncharacterized protein BX663DRAFT_555371 [Cokeromyces recurvatus]|uniref:uncharacterized protein n=1 Tax=Cokeromyces recurvatus TaxID=90255 RepID=UPI0022207BB6|nr:uncharacterized protein BX663DRAFT_555371 [Cokeromyces recurvatus]KAI7899046.1 hypothetical protein BX663DRAFT_555371 [Cokeromyces recurvatus]